MVLGDKVPEKDEVIQPLLNLPISEDIRATGAMQRKFSVYLSSSSKNFYPSERKNFYCEMYDSIPETGVFLVYFLKIFEKYIFADRHCGFFEMQWYKCLEAYGARLGRKYCDIEHRDFAECVNHDKSIKVGLV